MGRNKFFKTEFILRIERKQQRHRPKHKGGNEDEKKIGNGFHGIGNDGSDADRLSDGIH